MNLAEFVALFPGQGSQCVGMGRSLFESEALAQEIFAKADQILNFSLSSLCFDGPEDKLTLTQYAQPAILTVSTICFELARGSGMPKVAAGHSLGEYSALVAAGAIRFEDAVMLVHRRGVYMQEAVAPGIGKMVAVLGKEVSELENAISACASQEIDIANINAPGQVVVSGTKAAVDEFLCHLPNSKHVELPVSAPFHSRLMRPAAERLAKDLTSITVKEPEFPVISNVTAQPHTTPEEIKRLLAEQVCARVRWTECMQTVQERFLISGAREYGSGKVLAGLMKRINRNFQVVAVSDQATIVALAEEQAA